MIYNAQNKEINRIVAEFLYDKITIKLNDKMKQNN